MNILFILKRIALHLHLNAPLEYLNCLGHPSLLTYNFSLCVWDIMFHHSLWFLGLHSVWRWLEVCMQLDTFLSLTWGSSDFWITLSPVQTVPGRLCKQQGIHRWEENLVTAWGSPSFYIICKIYVEMETMQEFCTSPMCFQGLNRRGAWRRSSSLEIFYVHDKKVAIVIWIMWKQMSMTTGILFSRILLLYIWEKVVFESKPFVTWRWYFSFAVPAWHSWWLFAQFYVLWIWACLLTSAAIAGLERRSVLGIGLFIIGSKTSFIFLDICMKSLMPGESGKTKIGKIRIQIPILTI